MPAHYQVEFIKEDTLKMQQKTSPNITIHNARAVQIGDHNVQNIINAIQELQHRIDTATATPKEKTEAKSLLSQFLSHPVTVAILGGLSGGLVGQFNSTGQVSALAKREARAICSPFAFLPQSAMLTVME